MHGHFDPLGKKQKDDGNGRLGILRNIGQGRAMAFAAVLMVVGLSFSTWPQRMGWLADRTTVPTTWPWGVAQRGGT